MRRWMAVLVGAGLFGCRQDPAGAGPGNLAAAQAAPATAPIEAPMEVPIERDLLACRRRLDGAMAEPALPGDAPFHAHRAEILGRVRGEPVLFRRPPEPPPEADLPAPVRATRKAAASLSPRARVTRILASHRGDRAALRALLLREGYVYSADAEEASALVGRLRLTDLFDAPAIWLERGSRRHRLVRDPGRDPTYRHADGDLAGSAAELLLGDRLAADPTGLADAIHLDVRRARDEIGFDRLTPIHVTAHALVAHARFGEIGVRALFAAEGPVLSLSCLEAPDLVRRRVEQLVAAGAPRRRALARLGAAVDRAVLERLPFDRPRGVKDHLSDGQLRPLWGFAYRSGHATFSRDGESYPVFDAAGRPAPPQMCIDFVLDAFERSTGTWFRSRGEPPGRSAGGLDFDALGIANRAGVMAFGLFADQHPEAFDVARFAPTDRIPFGDRARFFGFLEGRADRFAAGDVVAIHGLKRDGYVHQHAILILDTDPITGIPYGLADQMRWPRRRTWEGIMAEAPKRSLYYRIRLAPELLVGADAEPPP